MSCSENPLENSASTSNRSVGRRPSHGQKVALLDWLEKNVDIATDKFADYERDAKSHHIWEEISPYLNSLGEAKKNGLKWRKFWMDLRNYTRNKYSFIQRMKRDNNDTFKRSKTLSPIEQRVVALIIPTSTNREQSIDDSQMEIEPTVKIEDCYSPIFEITENDFPSNVKIEENSIESLALENSFTENAETQPQISPIKISKRRKQNYSIAITNKKLINIEREKLKIEKAKLKIKKEKLKVAKQLLTIQKEQKEVLQAILEQITNFSYDSTS